MMPGSGSSTRRQSHHSYLSQGECRSAVGDDILLEPLFGGQAIHVGDYAGSPIDRVKQCVGGEDASATAEAEGSRPIFCEMMELKELNPDDERLVWKQSARWVKYEETVEGGGTRFSKPHITLTSIQCLLQLKNCLRRGAVLLDSDATLYRELVDAMISMWTSRRDLHAAAEVAVVRNVLLSPKLHMVKNRMRNASGRAINAVSEEDDVGEDEQTQAQGQSLSGNSPPMVNQSLMRKLPIDSESAVVLVGHVKELSFPISQFVRLRTSRLLHPELPELPVPVRFVFVLLSPYDHYPNETNILGRTMGSLIVDEVFKQVAYKAKESYTLTDAVEEFMSQSVIVPAGKWNPTYRWEPQEDMPPLNRTTGMHLSFHDPNMHMDHGEVDVGLRRTGVLFGGLKNDLKRKLPWYLSDFTDFFRGRITQSVAASIFLFFANVTKIITFGGVMEHMLHNQMASVENLLSGGICGIVYALFSGQPVAVLSATGPTLIFEAILFDFCEEKEWEYLPVRFWVGVWTAVLLLLLVALDASALVALITRFTEEAFATLISIIFIVQAFEELAEISQNAPLVTNPEVVLNDPCVCNFTDKGNRSFIYSNVTREQCANIGGRLTGMQCNFKPDVMMFSIILFFGTFTIAFGMKLFRSSTFLPSTFRQGIADFGVFLAIVIMTALAYFVGLDVPHLRVPTSFTPTLDRSWLVNPLNVNHWWIAVAALFPAIFFTILVVMDQQITAVIVNRADNKLQKGYGYHLDLLVIAVLMLVCAGLGIPFYVAATVISIMHVDSLRLQSECSAPGEKPQFLGVKEQRITALVAHVLVGSAVLLTPIIKLVPMPVLLGIFLYMGIVSLIGQQFVQRVLILFMPMKHQPDYSWLRVVHLKRVHLYTAIQILSLVALFTVKHTRQISMMFPIMLIFMVFMRMFVLEKIFTRKELMALDDPVPTLSEVTTPLRRQDHTSLPVIEPERDIILSP